QRLAAQASDEIADQPLGVRGRRNRHAQLGGCAQRERESADPQRESDAPTKAHRGSPSRLPYGAPRRPKWGCGERRRQIARRGPPPFQPPALLGKPANVVKKEREAAMATKTNPNGTKEARDQGGRAYHGGLSGKEYERAL